MSINLIESEHRTQKSLGGTFVSVAVHACVITLAVNASASAREAIVMAPIDSVTVVYTPAPNVPSRAPSQPMSPRLLQKPERVPGLPRSPIALPSEVPSRLPSIESSTTIIDDRGLFGSSSPDDGLPTGSKAACFADCGGMPYVEKPATARNGNPSPKYPSLLESSRVEGVVLVQFVVDTLGVADMSTFKVLEATNELFAESTRASLGKWRFYPAEAGGRKVRQIVQLPLRFVAPRR